VEQKPKFQQGQKMQEQVCVIVKVLLCMLPRYPSSVTRELSLPGGTDDQPCRMRQVHAHAIGDELSRP